MIPHKETTELINLNPEENKKEEAKMGTTLIAKERQDLMELLTKYNDVFTRCTRQYLKCSIYVDQTHPSTPLHTMSSLQPFSIRGIPVIESISPKALKGHQYISVMIDYSAT